MKIVSHSPSLACLIGFCVLFSLSFATPSWAFHCKGSHASDPACDGAGDSGGIDLLDASGTVIGRVTGIDGGQTVEILFDVSGQTFSAKIVGATLGGVLPGFVRSATVYFDNVNCTGAARISRTDEVQRVFFDAFRVAIIVGEEPDERRLYAPTSNVSESRTVNSEMAEVCRNTVQTRQLVPATLLDGDLHTTFPKPYSLLMN